jgi:hypothetical protein
MQEQKPGQEILELLLHFIPASATAEVRMNHKPAYHGLF